MYDMDRWLNWAGRPPSNAPEMFMAHNRPWTTDVDPGVTEEGVNQSETHWTGDIENEQQHYKITPSRPKCSDSALPSPKKDRQGLAKRSSSYENVKIFIWKYDDHQITIPHYDDQIMTIWRSSYEDRKKMNKEVLMCHLPQERPVSNGKERQWPPTRPRCIQL